MKDLLFLSQRLPYPPNKGDKIRSWHFFKHLAESHRMHLGCFIDDEADREHAATIAGRCASSLILPLRPARAKVMSLRGLLAGEALSLPYFRSRAMATWVAETMARHRPALVFVYCSVMAQYVLGLPRGEARLVVDMVDMDSQKWAQYAARKAWPASWIYRRESCTLHRFEAAASRRFDTTLFVSRAEAELYRRLTPGLEGRVDFVNNGVDLDYFSPGVDHPNPFDPGTAAIVFTGTMDYWPNIDAVAWFAEAIWPQIRARHPAARFVIVGANPSEAVKALAAQPGIVVTGRVPDIRPYLAHAAAVVAPLRVAQGVQNKVLEAMSMARPVVTSPQGLEGIDAEPGRDLLVAADAAEFAAAVTDLLRNARGDELGRRGRAVVERRYGWEGNLSRLSALCGPAAAATMPAEITS
jgi:sugar transferase (PEP-CTERM/EpsH1 system associated)